eukprot:33653-Pelagomonas_calceolata.AAC.2
MPVSRPAGRKNAQLMKQFLLSKFIDVRDHAYILVEEREFRCLCCPARGAYRSPPDPGWHSSSLVEGMHVPQPLVSAFPSGSYSLRGYSRKAPVTNPHHRAVVLQQSPVIGVRGAPTWRFEVQIQGRTGAHFGPLWWESTGGSFLNARSRTTSGSQLQPEQKTESALTMADFPPG